MKRRFFLLAAIVLLLALLCACIPSEDENDPTAPTLPAPSVTVPSGGEAVPDGTADTDAPIPTPQTPTDPFPGGKDDPSDPTQSSGKEDDPGQPGRPTEPDKPTDPTQSSQPTDPTQSSQPTDPTQPLPPDSAEDLVIVPDSPEDLH